MRPPARRPWPSRIIGRAQCEGHDDFVPFAILLWPPLCAGHSHTCSDLHQILANDDGAPEVRTGGVNPHLIGHGRILRGHEVREHESLDASRLCNTARILRGRMVGDDALLEGRRVGDAGDETIDTRQEIASWTRTSAP